MFNGPTLHTSLYGEALGLTTAELEQMKSDVWKTSTKFSERDKVVIAWSEAMTLNIAGRMPLFGPM